MLDYKIDCLPNIIYLGRQTENNVREIRVDCTAWIERWPDLIISAYVTPPDRGSAYLANTRMDGSVLCWTVDASDTARSGTGTVEFLGVADGLRKLSAACQTLIHATTTGTTSEPPYVDKPWVDRVIAAADMVEQKEHERESAEAERANAEAQRAETFAGYESRIDAATPDDSSVDGKPWTSRKIVDTLCPPFEVSGSIVQCHPVEHYPLGVVSRIDATQSGSGDASPDNIRPIVGWDSVSLNRCGKNFVRLSSKHSVGNTYTINGVDYTVNTDYSITAKGTVTGDSFFNFTSYKGNVFGLSKTTYNAQDNAVNINGFTFKDICVQYDGTKTMCYIFIQGGKTVDRVFYPQIELGSTATPYEPYTGDTYTAELPETIYGGELDWNTGVLTVDRGITIADGTVNKFTPDINETFWNMPFKSAPGTIDVMGVQNSHFKEDKFGLNGYNEFLFTMPAFMNGLFDTADNLNAYLVEQNAAGTPVQFCYELFNPYTVQLTPQQIAALTGINTLYTDSGDTAVSGRADPVWLTQSLMERIAALESTATNI